MNTLQQCIKQACERIKTSSNEVICQLFNYEYLDGFIERGWNVTVCELTDYQKRYNFQQSCKGEWKPSPKVLQDEDFIKVVALAIHKKEFHPDLTHIAEKYNYCESEMSIWIDKITAPRTIEEHIHECRVTVKNFINLFQTTPENWPEYVAKPNSDWSTDEDVIRRVALQRYQGSLDINDPRHTKVEQEKIELSHLIKERYPEHNFEEWNYWAYWQIPGGAINGINGTT